MKPNTMKWALAAALSLALGAQAATWKGTTSGSWATTSNWSDSLAPNGTVTYDATSANLTETLDGDFSIAGITVGTVTGAITLNKGTGGTTTLTLGTGGIDMSAAAQNMTINCNVTFGGTTSNLNVASGKTLQFGAGNASTLTFNAGTTTTINGAGLVLLGGSGSGTTLTGSGDFAISGRLGYNLNTNSSTSGYTGTMILNSGGKLSKR